MDGGTTWANFSQGAEFAIFNPSTQATVVYLTTDMFTKVTYIERQYGSGAVRLVDRTSSQTTTMTIGSSYNLTTGHEYNISVDGNTQPKLRFE